MVPTTDTLVVCFCVVAGENDELLGVDESPITAIYWTAINVAENEIIRDGEIQIAGTKIDKNVNKEGKEIENEDSAKEHLSLDEALAHFEQELDSLSKDDKTVRFVTENGLHLRQCLHPQAFEKQISLCDKFYEYFDLTKQYRLYKKNAIYVPNLRCIADDMLKKDYEQFLSTPKNKCHLSVRVVMHLLSEGHQFTELETIYKTFETGMTDGFVIDDTIARVRGLPWQVSDVDVADFFRGLNIERGGVALCLNEKGRRNGEALVRFLCAEHREMALRRHKHHLFGRYIEVYKGTAVEFSKIAKGPVSAMRCAEQFLSNGGQVLIRMRGLPFDASIEDILDFFGESPKVHQDKNGVMLVSHPDGSSTGDAFVLFDTEPEGQIALKKHRENIGKRYVELFRSTRAELQQVLTMYTTVCQIVHPLPGQLSTPGRSSKATDQALINQRLLAITNMSCVRLRGIPYAATEKDILTFLNTHAKNVVGSVHLIYNLQGRLSGEAFVQMRTADFASKCAKELHLEHMHGRYIEVFQCEVKDMACMVATSLASQFAAKHLNQLNSSPTNSTYLTTTTEKNPMFPPVPPPGPPLLMTRPDVPPSGRMPVPPPPPPTTSNGLLFQNITLIPIFTSQQHPPLLCTLPTCSIPPPPQFMQPIQSQQPPILPGMAPMSQPMVINPESIHIQVNQFG